MESAQDLAGDRRKDERRYERKNKEKQEKRRNWIWSGDGEWVDTD